jgi:hypothetical protein
MTLPLETGRYSSGRIAMRTVLSTFRTSRSRARFSTDVLRVVLVLSALSSACGHCRQDRLTNISCAVPARFPDSKPFLAPECGSQRMPRTLPDAMKTGLAGDDSSDYTAPCFSAAKNGAAVQD